MKIFIVFVDWLLAKTAVLKILSNEWETCIKRTETETELTHRVFQKTIEADIVSKAKCLTGEVLEKQILPLFQNYHNHKKSADS